MYPTTIVTWEDQSEIKTPEITNVRTMPLYASVITADKGTEDWVRLSGQEWFDMYAVNNTVDFERHGQALLQTAAAVEAGAEILCKRVVADDAMLANLAVIATTTMKPVQTFANCNFFAKAQDCNDYLGTTDAIDNTMFIKLSSPVGTDRYIIEVVYPNGQVYHVLFGDGTNSTATKLYWAAAEERQYDFGKTGTDPVIEDGNYTITLYSYTDDSLAVGTYPTVMPTNLVKIESKTVAVANGDGSNQTVETVNPASESVTTTVTYSFKSAIGCKTEAEVIAAINASAEEEKAAAGEGASVHPLWIFFDVGRGESKKRIRISANHQLSKTQSNYFMYDLEVIESGKRFDIVHFCIDPTLISDGSNISLQYQINTYSNQIRAYQFDDELLAFMDEMIAGTGMPEAEAIGMDLLFGTNKKGKAISGINVDVTGGVDLSIITGQLLQNGDNGSFGNAPIESELYGPQVAKAFAGYVINEAGEPQILTQSDGVYDTRIYDVDRYKIDAVLDANYPAIVKRAIEQLAAFREDFMYFRDMGTKCNTLDLIIAADYDNMKSKFCSTYCTYYDIIDPYSKKQITVTMCYSLAKQLVQQFNNGRNLPIAGIKYGFTIKEIVKNTLGFAPAICPGVNQKEDLYDLRINYATYIDDELVIESLYTSQEKYSQLSFANNVLAVQEVVKKIRSKCPAIRYTFIDGDDLEKYRAEVEEIIAPYKANFKSLNLTYMQDPYYTENKIFYATLAVQFRDFVQTEYFKIVALGSNVSTSAAAQG